ncbi:hypothetical protein SAMN05443252_101850 [Bacillus sp. OV322]|nr:hypothetical protein SAMN05443252_101850 [Bacillus sp. OV322]
MGKTLVLNGKSALALPRIYCKNYMVIKQLSDEQSDMIASSFFRLPLLRLTHLQARLLLLGSPRDQ